MESWTQVLLTSVASVIASSSFWAYMTSRDKKKDAMTNLIMGLGYDKLMTLGIEYLKRGWITKDEYEDYRKYLFEPYKALGGNGVAEKIMMEVSALPFLPHARYIQVVKDEEVSNERNRASLAQGRHSAAA